MTPTKEQIEDAKSLITIAANSAKSFGGLGFAMGSDSLRKFADFLAARDSRIIAEERVTRDAQWYDALKWAGIGGIMRVKIQVRVINTAQEVDDRAAAERAKIAEKDGGSK